MISHSHKFIFIHIPKTAGTSISEALRPYGLTGEGHYTLQRIQNKSSITDEQLNTFYKFAVVRNPWDIVVSHYSYSKMKKSVWHSDDGTTPYKQHPDYELTNNNVFKEFVRLLVNGKINNSITKEKQSHWLDKRLDFLIRFETLKEDFAKVCNKIGCSDVILKNINISKHNHYSTYYDDESRDWVSKYFSRDIKRLGYEFNV